MSESQRSILNKLFEKSIKSAEKVLLYEQSEYQATGANKEHYRMLKEIQIHVTSACSDEFNEKFAEINRELNSSEVQIPEISS